MKRSDFVRLMGNIDEKYLKEVENYSARPKNRVRIIALAACIAIIVTAIPLSLVLNREDTDSPVVTDPVVQPTSPDDEKSVQIIYCDAKTAEEIKKASKNKDIEIKDISEIETDLSVKVGDIEDSAAIPAKLYITVEGKEYTLKFNSAYSTVLSTSSNEQRRKDGSIALYEIEGKDLSEAHMRYCYESGRIIYLRLQSHSHLVEGDLTSEQAVALAEKDLTELYGEEFLQTYTLEFSELQADGSKNYYNIRYRRMICGYPTDEAVTIDYNMNSELINIVTSNFGSFDNIQDSLDIDKILKAESEAIKLIGDKKIEFTLLATDKEGKVYMYVAYTDGYTFQLYYAIDGTSAKPGVD